MRFFRVISLVLATGFGLGYSPIASGTTGSLPGVALAWILWSLIPSPIHQIFLALFLVLAAVPICSYAESFYHMKDDRRIVADEYLTFPVCVIGLPIIEHPLLLAVAFVTCRGFDILKPWPAYQSQRLPRGWGIVADDVFASLYSLAINHVIWRMWSSMNPVF